jgi:AraC-like DNA-binding protein
MEQNLAEPLSISNIASQIGVGVRQLERVFGEQLESTPHESYLALRLRHGRWMLKNDDLSSSRIAAELGFSDASHFGRSFKSLYGVTPAAFRKQVKDSPPGIAKITKGDPRLPSSPCLRLTSPTDPITCKISGMLVRTHCKFARRSTTALLVLTMTDGSSDLRGAP